MNDDPIEMEDDHPDVVDIMSQSYLNIDEEETEENITLNVVDISLQIYWDNNPEYESMDSSL